MNRKGLKTLLLVIAGILFLCLCAIILLRETVCSDKDIQQSSQSTVQPLEQITDDELSSYQVGTDLPGTDLSDLSQLLMDKLAQEWSIYDAMTKEQRIASSKLWGLVSIQTDSWDECEEAIGFRLNNPLEKLKWLENTGYYGMESTDPDIPEKHIQITVNAAQSLDRSPYELRVTAGYLRGNVRVTLTATLRAKAGAFETGRGSNGYATYEQSSAVTKSGHPVLIVTTDEANNTLYYHGDYYDPTAYWVKDNVFYTLRVFGDEADRAEIQETLEQILNEI